MQQGLTISDLARKIEANKELKQDYIADTTDMTMAIQADGVPVLDLPGQGSFPIQPIAHDQIAARIGIPGKYYDRMRADDPGLMATNVNAWFRRQPERRMIRTLGGDARAFLSNRYQRIENEEIAAVALPILADLPGVQIPSCEVTDRRLYIHFVVPTIQGEVKRGDVVQAGGIISNSEVGHGSVSVSGLIWRLACLNGMKNANTYRRNHVGRKIDDNDDLWADDTKQADDRTVLLKVRDMVRAVVDQTRFETTMGKLQGLTEGKIKGDPVAGIEVLGRKIGATATEQSAILLALINGGDLSRWGVVNAVTACAHFAPTYDRAVEFESMGGSLVDLPAAEWREILQAA